MVASTITATASPTPSCFTSRRPPIGEPGEHDDDEQRGRRDDPARSLEAEAHGQVVVAGLDPGLLDAGEQEHLVVHRQAEGEDEDDERDGGIERADGVEAEQARQVAVLEHPDQGAEGGAERQHVHHHRLHRHHDRAGHEEQQHEGPEHHQGEGEGQSLGDGRLVVDELGGVAGHQRGERRPVVAQAVHEGLRRRPGPARRGRTSTSVVVPPGRGSTDTVGHLGPAPRWRRRRPPARGRSAAASATTSHGFGADGGEAGHGGSRRAGARSRTAAASGRRAARSGRWRRGRPPGPAAPR